MAAKSDSDMQDDLENRLKSHSAYFSSMVELIPAKFYIIKDDIPEEDDRLEMDSKFFVNKRSIAPKQAVKEATKKAKRLKLDPSSNKSREKSQRDADKNDVGGGPKGSLMEESKEQGSGSSNEGKESVSKRHSKATMNGFSVERVQSGDLGDLRDRLHNRLAELRGKRKLLPNTESAREGEEEGGEDSSTGVTEKRQKVVERRQRKKELKKKGKARKQVVKQQSREKRDTEGITKRPSIKDESGRVVFSKFDFGMPATAHLEAKPKSKDYRKLLAKAEAAQKKLEKLKEVDEKKSEQLHETLQWQRAMEMAKGVKLKDDSKRLKKTVKRLDSKKAKSKKQWLERQNQQSLAKERRQEKRKKNIQERIDQVKAKKLKKRGGKTRRPGF